MVVQREFPTVDARVDWKVWELVSATVASKVDRMAVSLADWKDGT